MGTLYYGDNLDILRRYLAIRGHWVGPLLWPVVVLHAVIAMLLGRAWLMRPKTVGRNNPAYT